MKIKIAKCGKCLMEWSFTLDGGERDELAERGFDSHTQSHRARCDGPVSVAIGEVCDGALRILAEEEA